MNFSNRYKNLIILIIVALVSSFITYKATISSAIKINEQALTALTPSLIEAIKKETTAIKNEIAIDIKKIKKLDTLSINVNQSPKNNLTQQVKEIIPKGCNKTQICIEIKNLTRKQRKRLGVK